MYDKFINVPVKQYNFKKMENYFKTRLVYDKRREEVWKEICNYLQRYVSRNSVVLDFGAGYCSFINNINVKEKHALDLSDIIKKHAQKDVVTHIGKINEVKSLKADYFDVVFASNILEHLDDEEFTSAIQTIHKILKKDGKLIIIQPNFKKAYKEYFDDYTHKKIFTETSLVDALKTFDFRIEKSVPGFLPYSMKSGLPVARTLIRLYLNSPIKPMAKQMLIIARKN